MDNTDRKATKGECYEGEIIGKELCGRHSTEYEEYQISILPCSWCVRNVRVEFAKHD